MNDTTDDPVREYTDDELADMVRGYLECALWSTTDNSDPDTGGDPMDEHYDTDDIDAATVRQAEEDCAAMLSLPEAGEYLARINTRGQADPAEAYGHDFWLTRNGHGTGYWDRGLGVLGDRIAAMARPYGSVDLYVGDDGRIYS
jgi:hypothetical protein